MRSVENEECQWKKRGVENAECRKCGVWKMKSVKNDVECEKCGVWIMRSVAIRHEYYVRVASPINFRSMHTRATIGRLLSNS